MTLGLQPDRSYHAYNSVVYRKPQQSPASRHTATGSEERGASVFGVHHKAALVDCVVRHASMAERLLLPALMQAAFSGSDQTVRDGGGMFVELMDRQLGSHTLALERCFGWRGLIVVEDAAHAAKLRASRCCRSRIVAQAARDALIFLVPDSATSAHTACPHLPPLPLQSRCRLAVIRVRGQWGYEFERCYQRVHRVYRPQCVIQAAGLHVPHSSTREDVTLWVLSFRALSMC